MHARVMVGRRGLFPAARGQLTQLNLFPTYNSHINLSISLPTPTSSPWPKLKPKEPPKGGAIQKIRSSKEPPIQSKGRKQAIKNTRNLYRTPSSKPSAANNTSGNTAVNNVNPNNPIDF
ncbi:hypothetical protein RRF57_009098 [Xylaria bambusicola]|uniref:Uncharacterized protein n=1 Tax=Xylaria bambusicola TaxID=326684 RepID=A0AAN7UT46_9PEZI